MQQRVASGVLQAGPEDRELTERKQRQIVDGAAQVLLENGFCKTSIRDIAGAAGMSMGQLYHYIGSKDDVLYLMHRRDQEMWYRHLAESGIDEIEDPVEKLEYGLRINIKYLSDHRDFVQFIFTESKYLDREHLDQVLEMDNHNVVGFYRHLLAGLPDFKYKGQGGRVRRQPGAPHLSLPRPAGLEPRIEQAGRYDAVVDFLVDFILHGLEIQRVAGK